MPLLTSAQGVSAEAGIQGGGLAQKSQTSYDIWAPPYTSLPPSL